MFQKLFSLFTSSERRKHKDTKRGKRFTKRHTRRFYPKRHTRRFYPKGMRGG